jgi:rhodanese-related sulfurtransferase
MKKYFALFLSFWAACQTDSTAQNRAFSTMLHQLLSHSVPEISVEKAVTDSTVVFLDTRAREEYDVSHIDGAIWVGYDEFSLASVAQLAHNQPIIVYCSVGYRSEKVSEKLIEGGFENVQNMYGGIFEWVNQGHKIVDQNGRTNRVHAFDRTWGVWLRRGKKVY